MTISNETSKRIEDFSRDQSRHYLDRAHMTYWEKLQDKASRTHRKVSNKAARFKLRSAQSEEAQGDLTVYMHDFMEDLMAKGATEEEAFEQARQELAYDSGSSTSNDLQDLYAQKLEELEARGYSPEFVDGIMGHMGLWDNGGDSGEPANRRYQLNSAIGMFYAGFPPIGLAVGGLVGFLTSGGVPAFLHDGWIYTLVGLVVGAVIGAGIAMICQGILLALRR